MKPTPHRIPFLAAVLLNAVVVVIVFCLPRFRESQTIAFVDVTVVPMDTERTVPHQTVLVRDGRIAAMGPAAEVAVPETAQRIDGRGRFLMPGLTDMHAHLHSPHEFPLYLANGVTTVYNLHGA